MLFCVCQVTRVQNDNTEQLKSWNYCGAVMQKQSAPQTERNINTWQGAPKPRLRLPPGPGPDTTTKPAPPWQLVEALVATAGVSGATTCKPTSGQRGSTLIAGFVLRILGGLTDGPTAADDTTSFSPDCSLLWRCCDSAHDVPLFSYEGNTLLSLTGGFCLNIAGSAILSVVPFDGTAGRQGRKYLNGPRYCQWGGPEKNNQGQQSRTLSGSRADHGPGMLPKGPTPSKGGYTKDSTVTDSIGARCPWDRWDSSCGTHKGIWSESRLSPRGMMARRA
ncbi:hypothetical protein EYF80_038577 [Liparis tanakae]|uniref:Uncharacterized protein n=1 Tax=Liparis tanakae TaxID=230148 RepID=A0A4Z2GE84_9TELE|nr:hypothetical protein EYF80_038577 [Liparis tanakae]